MSVQQRQRQRQRQQSDKQARRVATSVVAFAHGNPVIVLACAVSGYALSSQCTLSSSVASSRQYRGSLDPLLEAHNVCSFCFVVSPFAVFLACMFFCIFSQLHFLALGLSFFDALYVVPVFQWSVQCARPSPTPRAAPFLLQARLCYGLRLTWSCFFLGSPISQLFYFSIHTRRSR